MDGRVLREGQCVLELGGFLRFARVLDVSVVQVGEREQKFGSSIPSSVTYSRESLSSVCLSIQVYASALQIIFGRFKCSKTRCLAPQSN